MLVGIMLSLFLISFVTAVLEENKSCSSDSDCRVTSCAYCVNKNQTETTYCDRPRYELYYTLSCKCENNTCNVVKNIKNCTTPECYAGLAIETRDYSVCKNYLDEKGLSSVICYTNIAVILNNQSVCNLINDPKNEYEWCGKTYNLFQNYSGQCKRMVSNGIIRSFAIGNPFEGPCLNETDQIVGGDHDSHGCIGSAGYMWCEEKQKCLRIWEEGCNSTINNTIRDIKDQLKNLKEQRKKLMEDIKQYRGEVKEMMKKYNGWMNVTDMNITIHELSDNQKEIIINKINTKTGLNLTLEDINNQTILKTLLSNGRFAEIKILPDRASERAKEVLKAKCEERNCTLELKEVGIGNKTRLAYEITTNQSSKVLLFFKRNIPLKAQIDAETGDVISVKKPWWAFLARAEK